MQENQFFVGLDMNKNPIKNALGEKVSMSMKVLSSDFSSTNLIKTSQWVIPAGALVTSVTWKPVSTPTSGVNDLAIGLETGSGSITLVSNHKIWLGDSNQTNMFPIDCYVPNDSTLQLSVDSQFYSANIEGLIIVEYALNVEYNALNAGQSKNNVHMDLDGLTSGETFGCAYRALNQARFPVFGSHPWTAGTNQDKYGYFYYNSKDKKLYIYDSTCTWVTWTGGGAQDDCYHYSQFLSGTNCFSDWSQLEDAWNNSPKPIIIEDFINGATDLSISLTGAIYTPLRILVNPALLSIGLVFNSGGVVELYGGDFDSIIASAAIIDINANAINRLELLLDNDYITERSSSILVNTHINTLLIGNCTSVSDIQVRADTLFKIDATDCNVRQASFCARVWHCQEDGVRRFSKSVGGALSNYLANLPKPDFVFDVKDIFIESSNDGYDAGIELLKCYAVIHNSSIYCRNFAMIHVACVQNGQENDWAILRLKNCDLRTFGEHYNGAPIVSLNSTAALISEYSVYRTLHAEPIVRTNANSVLYNYDSRANNSIAFTPLCDNWTVYTEVL